MIPNLVLSEKKLLVTSVIRDARVSSLVMVSSKDDYQPFHCSLYHDVQEAISAQLDGGLVVPVTVCNSKDILF